MRHTKTIVIVVLLVGGAWAAMQWAARDPSVRGQDPNVETRALNTSGVPAEGTSGRAGTAWVGDETFVARAIEMHTALGASAGEGAAAPACRRDHETARRELESLAERNEWSPARPGGQGPQRALGESHEQALAAVVQAESQASDAELRAWAGRSATMIRQHIAAAKGGS